MFLRPTRSTLFPYTTLFRSGRARREIQGRARELQREIDEADAWHDLGRAERAREELDRIVEVLSGAFGQRGRSRARSEEHTSELQSQSNLVCRLLLEKKKKK